MPFRPKPEEKIEIEGKWYSFTEHPSARNMAYGQAGRRATVYQMQAEDNSLHALKVFTKIWRDPRIAESVQRLHTYANLPGLQVCDRQVITLESHALLIAAYPDLEYAVLMGWVLGETWQEVMLTGRPLNFEQSRELGLAFLDILVGMEREGLAHCDLSGPNVLLKFSPVQVALVDVEDLYGPGLVRPEKVGGGSSGYAHKTAPKGLWRADADRFAGAILLAEMLGWSDERVRRIGYGEQYFDPAEVQHNSERYQVLLSVLREQWGNPIADAFARVWFSERLEDCPSFQEWESLINPPEHLVDQDKVQAMINEAEELLGDDQVEESIGELEEVYQIAPEAAAGAYARALLTRGTTRERNNDLGGALLDYQKALQIAPEGGLQDELKLIVIETKQKFIQHGKESQENRVSQIVEKTENGTKINELIDQEYGRSVNLKSKEFNKNNLLVIPILGILLIIVSFFIGRLSVSLPSSLPTSLSENLYFASNRSGNFEIYRLYYGQPVRVTHSANGGSWDPVTSPNGVLYFTSDRNGNKEIYYLSGTEVVQVTHAPGYRESWSPFFVDNILYFVSNRSGKSEIWRMVAGVPEQVTLTPGMAISIITNR